MPETVFFFKKMYLFPGTVNNSRISIIEFIHVTGGLVPREEWALERECIEPQNLYSLPNPKVIFCQNGAFFNT